MPDPVSALHGARFAGPDVAIAEQGAVGMVSLRGDLADAGFGKALKTATGCAVPAMRRVETAKDASLVWMSPDELMLVCGYGEAPALAAKIGEALAGTHHMAAVASDARAVFRIEGEGARELLAKGAPVDLSPADFGPGDVRRTRLGQVAAAFWLGEDGAFSLVCFRSLGGYVFDWLKASAKDGARPGLF
ncbi:MAG: sarcosine oxidase subunit gamma family protein [Pseudomonadota bacterium]